MQWIMLHDTVLLFNNFFFTPNVEISGPQSQTKHAIRALNNTMNKHIL